MCYFLRLFMILAFVSSSFVHARLKPVKSIEEFSGTYPKEHYFLFEGTYGSLEKIDFKGSTQTSLKFKLKGQFPELREIKVDGRAAWDPGKYNPTGVLMQIFGEAPELESVNVVTKSGANKLHIEKAPFVEKIIQSSTNGKITINISAAGMESSEINLTSTEGDIHLIVDEEVPLRVETNLPMKEKKRKSFTEFFKDVYDYESESWSDTLKDFFYSGQWVYYTVKRIQNDLGLEIEGSKKSKNMIFISSGFDPEEPHILVKVKTNKGYLYLGSRNDRGKNIHDARFP